MRQAYDLPVEVIAAQIDAVFDDFEVAAVKTGMLSSCAIVEAVSERLAYYKPANLVVDPVMISKSGFALLKPDAIEGVKTHLFPLAAIVTPNVHEARLLADMEIASVDEAKAAARKILTYGPSAVLVKGGHLEGSPYAVDVLFDGEEETLLEAERIDTPNTHGTGCTYSAAIAAQLARGRSLKEAVGKAKVYITEAIRHSLAIGHGHGPTNHFYFLEAGR